MRLNDPLLLAAVDDNVDAMIVAHGLSHLPRAEAFAILDDPAIAGLERWEDAAWGYSRESTPRELDPWLQRIPRSHEYFLYRRGSESDIAIGGTGYEDFPPGAKHIIGYTITVVLADLTVRFRGRGDDFLKWRLVDPLPSLRCRSFFQRHARWTDHENGTYRFAEGTVLFGQDLSDEVCYCISRDTVWPELNYGQHLAVAAWWEAEGLPYGQSWYLEMSDDS